MTVKNKYRVPKSQWNKWRFGSARQIFNEVYWFALGNQQLLTHPKMPLAKPDHWKTIAWNVAWIAADAALDAMITEVKTRAA